MNFDEFKALLEKYGQSHIAKSYERLNDEGKENLMQQVARIDFEKMKDLYALSQTKVEMKDAIIEPMAYQDSAKLSAEEKAEIIELGEAAIRAGKLAIVTMAGGQGTRLGHDGPKGTYDLGLESHKSLFEIQCDILKAAQEKYGVTVPWYIMTSRENNDDTVAFFEKNNYFGYPKEATNYFFKQGELPMMDEAGRLVIEENGLVKEAADGHGGVFEALGRNGILADMKARGIEWIFIAGIDNVLVQLVDPLLMGYAIKNNFRIVSKTVPKSNPDEKVGVFCKKDGKPYVIEYSEISTEHAHMRDENGELVYGEGHVLLNLFNVSALEEIEKFKLPYHVAHKKTAYMNEEGEFITPESPNAYKFESFLFDAFSQIPEFGLLRGKREEDFSPVKNATGVDSPETARRDYLKYHGLEK
ncbi:MAG: UDPGP type 1 family protein [Clostridia bacterium]|nr:UDPGP type 1 family protein [Clostridia bacterium]